MSALPTVAADSTSAPKRSCSRRGMAIACSNAKGGPSRRRSPAASYGEVAPGRFAEADRPASTASRVASRPDFSGGGKGPPRMNDPNERTNRTRCERPERLIPITNDRLIPITNDERPQRQAHFFDRRRLEPGLRQEAWQVEIGLEADVHRERRKRAVEP